MSTQYLTFLIDRQVYGIEISAIREINRISEITKLPEAPSHVSGVMNLRGKVIPVVSLRLRMKLSEVESTKETCTIVVDTNAGQVGFVVDGVQSVMSLESSDVDGTPVHQGDRSYIRGIGRIESGMVILIDIEKCLGDVAVDHRNENTSQIQERVA